MHYFDGETVCGLCGVKLADKGQPFSAIAETHLNTCPAYAPVRLDKAREAERIAAREMRDGIDENAANTYVNHQLLSAYDAARARVDELEGK